MMTLYHGSERIISRPFYGGGSIHNDYGMGFYCTEHIELAKEWASKGTGQSFVNKYSFTIEGLKVLSLLEDRFSVLNWLAILLDNRVFAIRSPGGIRARDYMLNEFLPDYKKYDIIRGYRADDSYFAFANDFLNGQISLRQLSRAMMLGRLGEQIVLKSANAFDHIRFMESIPVDSALYGEKRIRRDIQARNAYSRLAADTPGQADIIMMDIVRNQWKDGDERLR